MALTIVYTEPHCRFWFLPGLNVWKNHARGHDPSFYFIQIWSSVWCNEFWTFHQMNSLENSLLAVWILGKLYPGVFQTCSIKTWNLVILHSSHSCKFPSCKLTIMQCDSTANILSWNLPILHSYELERLSCKKLSWNQVWISKGMTQNKK